MKKILIAISVLICIVCACIPTYAEEVEDSVIISVVEKTEDEIIFDVAIGPTVGLAGFQIKLIAPEGLTYVDGHMSDGLKDELGVYNCGFNPKVAIFGGGHYPVGAYVNIVAVGGMDYSSDTRTDVLRLTYSIDDSYDGSSLGVDMDYMCFINVDSSSRPVEVIYEDLSDVELSEAGSDVSENRVRTSFVDSILRIFAGVYKAISVIFT